MMATSRRMEPLLRGFGIKAKPPAQPGLAGAGASAPRFWNQGKARDQGGAARILSLCSAVLESRQSEHGHPRWRRQEPLLRGFGIKAKQSSLPPPTRTRASAPRFWNQGKADVADEREVVRASAPRFWNQGKAQGRSSCAFVVSLCSAVLESRQSFTGRGGGASREPLLRGFGIKAKQRPRTDPARRRASAPRFWNQGKAGRPRPRRRHPSLCSAVLESRQSRASSESSTSTEPLLRGFGIKAKQDLPEGASHD